MGRQRSRSKLREKVNSSEGSSCVPITNRYATLPTDVGNAPPAEVKRTKKRKKNQGQSDGASGRDTMTNVSDIGEFGGTVEHENSAVPSAAKVKLPPLVVMKVPLNTLIGDLTSLGVAAEFKLSRIGTKVMLRTKAEYEATVKYLKDSRAEYFTHDIPGEKPFKVVIRGLPNFNPKSIEEELKDRYKLAPIAVFRMTRRDENVKTYPDCLFLVHFQKGTVTLNALKAIRSINFIIVQWEPYRGGRHDVTQCQRCLNFGCKDVARTALVCRRETHPLPKK
ncbi:uncharacterized protein LOC135712207 [Ochlerotatus camptorhynchus]|uniref:uncharacterized protein LOC135712207 n=1 Tax=Ochlerotatus camptorhynchus TaxID=644619 RepID=UPI0031DD2D4E